MEWYEWAFSGIGVFLIGLFFVKTKKSQKQVQKSGKNSINVQSGKDVNINLK